MSFVVWNLRAANAMDMEANSPIETLVNPDHVETIRPSMDAWTLAGTSVWSEEGLKIGGEYLDLQEIQMRSGQLWLADMSETLELKRESNGR